MRQLAALLLLLLASCSGSPATGRYQYIQSDSGIYFIDTQAGRVWMLTSLDPEAEGKAAATWKEIETPVTGKNRP